MSAARPRARNSSRRLALVGREPFLPQSRPCHREIARFLRVQLPTPIPERGASKNIPGLIGLSLLGFRIIRPGQG